MKIISTHKRNNMLRKLLIAYLVMNALLIIETLYGMSTNPISAITLAYAIGFYFLVILFFIMIAVLIELYHWE